MISDVAERALLRIIDMYQIHLPGALPVPIRQVALNEGWRIIYREGVFPLYGFAIVHGSQKIIGINADISLTWQRATIAHELGHSIADHSPGLQTMTHTLDWTKAEHEASEIGAELLIPEWTLTEFETREELAVACDVPFPVVENRLGDW